LCSSVLGCPWGGKPRLPVWIIENERQSHVSPVQVCGSFAIHLLKDLGLIFLMHIVIFVLLAFVAGMLLHRQLVRTREAKVTAMPPPLSSYEASVTTATFTTMVLETSTDKPVLVDFYAAWCRPCHYLGPVLAEMAKNYKGNFLLAKVDVDAEPSLAKTYSIKSMPTVLLFRDGRRVAEFVGARQEHSVRFFLAQNGVLPPAEEAADA